MKYAYFFFWLMIMNYSGWANNLHRIFEEVNAVNSVNTVLIQY